MLWHFILTLYLPPLMFVLASSSLLASEADRVVQLDFLQKKDTTLKKARKVKLQQQNLWDQEYETLILGLGIGALKVQRFGTMTKATLGHSKALKIGLAATILSALAYQKALHILRDSLGEEPDQALFSEPLATVLPADDHHKYYQRIINIHASLRDLGEEGPEHEKSILANLREDEQHNEHLLAVVTLESNFKGLATNHDLQEKIKKMAFFYGEAKRLRLDLERRQQVYETTKSLKEWTQMINETILKLRFNQIKNKGDNFDLVP